jgi:hypothetical protein
MGMPAPAATNAFSRLLAQHNEFPLLQRGADPGALTVLHMVGAADLDDYERRACEWGYAVWASWDLHHAAVRDALEGVL